MNLTSRYYEIATMSPYIQETVMTTGAIRGPMLLAAALLLALAFACDHKPSAAAVQAQEAAKAADDRVLQLQQELDEIKAGKQRGSGAAAGTGLAAGTADTVIPVPARKPIAFTLAKVETVDLAR
jgi:hypothetical protein